MQKLIVLSNLRKNDNINKIKGKNFRLINNNQNLVVVQFNLYYNQIESVLKGKPIDLINEIQDYLFKNHSIKIVRGKDPILFLFHKEFAMIDWKSEVVYIREFILDNYSWKNLLYIYFYSSESGNYFHFNNGKFNNFGNINIKESDIREYVGNIAQLFFCVSILDHVIVKNKLSTYSYFKVPKVYYMNKDKKNTYISLMNMPDEIKFDISTTLFKIEHIDEPDPRANIFDSSIWFRKIENASIPNELDEYLNNTVEFLKLNSSKEYRDFQIRMYENSYLFSKNEGSSKHGDFVTPFKFHSESSMYNNYLVELEKINKLVKGEQFKWKIAIIDDHASKHLQNGFNYTKTEIITKVLNLSKLSGDEFELNKNISFEICPYSSYSDPLLNIEYFDIIFMDYLFINDNSIIQLINYGDKYVDNLLKKFKDLKVNNAFGKFWIYPISAYNFAFLDALNNKGISFYNEHLVLSTGGDPICTPNLFKYKFIEFLHLQLLEFIDAKDGNILEEINELLVGFNELMNFALLQKRLKSLYPRFVIFGSKLQKLIEMKPQSSFATSIISNLAYNISDFEKLWVPYQQIIHDIAYGDESYESQIRFNYYKLFDAKFNEDLLEGILSILQKYFNKI